MRALTAGVRRACLPGALAALALSGASACTSLSGIGDLEFVEGGGGAGGSGAGAGGAGGSGAGAGGAGAGGAGAGGAGGSGAGAGGAGGSGAGAGGAGAGGAGAGGAGGGQAPVPPTAAELLALTTSCQQASSGLFRNSADPGPEPSIPVCALNGAYFWRSGMGIDCDGLSHESPECPSATPHTAAVDSLGNALDSLQLPFVVVPNGTPAECADVLWSHTDAGLRLGAAVAVVHGDKVAYGVVGDVGECHAIGMASYAMAQSLGINVEQPSPGVMSGVTYIVFAGPDAVVDPVEDHAKAVELGTRLASELVADP
ncbi:glycoside hydrolase family 75 protein [Sorangium sp. So ce887]|uniref:glycoside hydrolase family 75 protein n=1 Tax=Sorangium sp. So ce887 TaxID=3133324 RepID=UPI003F645A50